MAHRLSAGASRYAIWALFAGFSFCGLSAAATRLELAVTAPSAQLPTDGIAATVVATRAAGENHGAPKALRIPTRIPAVLELDLESGTSWMLQAEADGFWSPEVAIYLGEETVARELHLVRSGQLSGVVEPPRGEKPPQNLELRFQSVPSDRGQVDLGPFTVRCPVAGDRWTCELPAARLDVRLRAGHWVPEYLWGVVVEVGKTRELERVRFRVGASVVGRVTTSSAEPLPDRTVVRLLPPTGRRSPDPLTESRLQDLTIETAANEQGFFQFAGVATGVYTAIAEAPGYAAASVTPVEVQAAVETEIAEPLVLTPPASLQLVIEPPLDPYGEPWRVLLTPMDSGRQVVEPLDRRQTSDGTANWDRLAPGRYLAVVEGGVDGRWINQDLELQPGANELTLSVDLVEVRGSLRLGEEPVSARLWFGGKYFSQRVRFDSDAEGRFSGFLPQEGSWPVDIETVDEDLRLATPPVEVRVRRGRSYAAVEIVLPDTRLVGEVVDEEGKPVGGARVSVEGLADRKLLSSERLADPEGGFEFRGLAPGSMNLHAMDTLGRESAWVPVDLDEDSPSPPVRLVLARRNRITGRVSSRFGPVPGATVLALPGPLGADVPVATGRFLLTDPQGTFTLELPSDATTVTWFVMARGYAFKAFEAPVTTDAPLDVFLSEEGGTLVLRTARPQEAMGPQVTLLHDGHVLPLGLLVRWARMQQATAPEAGLLVVPQVEPGDYAMCVNGEALAAFLAGAESTDDACAAGFLPPLGELRLEVDEVRESAAVGSDER